MEQVIVALQNLLVAVLNVLVITILPIFTQMAVQFLKLKLKELEARLTEQQISQFRDIVVVAISAAEKLGLTDALRNTAAAKKAAAIATVQAYVDAHKLNIPVEQIEAEIENALHLGLQNAEDIDDAPSKPIGFGANMGE